MSAFKYGAGDTQNVPGALYHMRKQGRTSKVMSQKDQLEEASVGQRVDNLSIIKDITTMD